MIDLAGLEAQVAKLRFDGDSRSGDPRETLTGMCGAVSAVLMYAVRKGGSGAEGVQILKERGIAPALRSIDECSQALFAEFLDGKPVQPAMDEVQFLHVAWLVDEPATGARVIERYGHPKYRRTQLKNAFWDEYRRGMGALARGEAYEPKPRKAAGIQKTWLPLMDLMSARSRGQDPAEAVRRCEEAFAKRNKDKRLYDPGNCDGDGNEPVRWDFRMESILRCPVGGNGA